jgi:hypothetical protein
VTVPLLGAALFFFFIFTFLVVGLCSSDFIFCDVLGLKVSYFVP